MLITVQGSHREGIQCLFLAFWPLTLGNGSQLGTILRMRQRGQTDHLHDFMMHPITCLRCFYGVMASEACYIIAGKVNIYDVWAL